MSPLTLVLSLLLPLLAHGSPTQPTAAAPSGPLQYANHIFNAIHSSMRQWGSSLNHNGMSSFIASVPAGTQLYHGTNQRYRINGTEWLAFEPEHAMLFARGRGPPPGHGGRGDQPGGGPGRGPPPQRQEPTHHDRMGDFELVSSDQAVLLAEESKALASEGWVHTYRTKEPLRLLYVDGQSAAKSSKGTLDLQDYVVLQDGTAVWGDYERAAGMCKIAQEEWNGAIDGILRMEGGFEIILCSFAKHVDVVRITESNHDAGDGHPGGRDNGDSFNYYEAVAARFDGIGGGRVTLDYDNFATLFASPDEIYFDDQNLPRVSKNDTNATDMARKRIDKMVLSPAKPSRTNWQAVADMVVARYADRIEYLASGDLKDKMSLDAEIDRALRPFIDYSARNATLEIERCSQQFMPATATAPTLALRAVQQVATTLCTALTAAAARDDYASALADVRDLKGWLSWTTWKRCRGCRGHELCFLPIWPKGSAEDFETPRCRSDISAAPGGYWNDFGGPGGPGGRHPRHDGPGH